MSGSPNRISEVGLARVMDDGGLEIVVKTAGGQPGTMKLAPGALERLGVLCLQATTKANPLRVVGLQSAPPDILELRIPGNGLVRFQFDTEATRALASMLHVSSNQHEKPKGPSH